MTAPGKARRDKGTRGGRPEPRVPQARAPRTPRRPAAVRQPAVAAQPGETAPAASPVPKAWRWVTGSRLEAVTWLLSLAGLGVSVYLTIIHYTNPAGLYCSESGLVNCTKVTTSPESVVFGIPVAVLGLAFYVFMTAVNSPWGWRAAWRPLRWARAVPAVGGMAFVLYLFYTEMIRLNAICLWCTAVHLITFALFGLVVFASSGGHPAGDR